MLSGEERGRIKITYTGELIDSNPFLVEEYQLLGAVMSQIAQILNRSLLWNRIKEISSRLEAVLNNIPDGIITFDSKGIIETFNKVRKQYSVIPKVK